MSSFDWFNKKLETWPGGSIVLRYLSTNSPRLISSEGSSARFGAARDKVYRRRFGEPAIVFHEMPRFNPHIDVMEYRRTGPSGEYCFLVTSGISDLAMRVPPESRSSRRIELIFYCTEPRPEYAEALRWLGRFAHDQNTWIGAFHTIQNGTPPALLWGSASLDTFWLLPPLVIADRDLQSELTLDGDGVELLWVVPISVAERNFKMSQGSKALLDLLNSNGHGYIFGGDRGSYV